MEQEEEKILKTYTVEIEVTYENGDEENYKIIKDSYQVVEYWMKDGCLKVAWKDKERYRQGNALCYVRKYKVVDTKQHITNIVKKQHRKE
tara:strand:+ start:833 stop:1102 length:270 start_codon:yes stop_codon:yes gene_type:complete